MTLLLPEKAEELLKASLFALNGIPKHTLYFPGYKDTYALAREISKFFKDIEEVPLFQCDCAEQKGGKV